jgi:hypothetical protein
MSDGNAEIDIKAESVIKETFFKSRTIEQQRTLWTNMPTRAMNNAAVTPTSMTPKLKPVDDYITQRVEKDYMSILMGGLHEREQYFLTGDDQELASSIRDRIKAATDYFEHSVLISHPK